MEEEINIRPYIEALIQNWKWIIGAGLLAAVITFGVSSLIKPTYQATALVAIAEPRQRLQFDPRIETVADDQPLKAYPELAMSDEVLTILLSQAVVNNVTNLTSLKSLLEAEPGSDPSLLRLTVRHNDPSTAASLANEWAGLFVNWANEVYGSQGGDQLRFFEEQLLKTAAELAIAEQALTDFQAKNRVAIISNELTVLKDTQANFFSKQQEITILAQDVQALRTQIERQSSAGDISVADQITSLFLEMKAFNVETEVPLQLHLDTTQTLTQQSRQEQIQFLDNLLETLADRMSEIDANMVMLEPQILALQQAEQEMLTENDRVTRNYEIAEETYTALARKVEEERIASQDNSNGVKMASETAVPEEPVSPRKMINTIIAGNLGMMLVTIAVLFTRWRHNIVDTTIDEQ